VKQAINQAQYLSHQQGHAVDNKPVVSNARNPPGCNATDAPWQMRFKLSRPGP